MAEVFFYHLTQTPLEVTLPDLLQKSAARGWRVLVKGTSDDRLRWLDDRLWMQGDDSFLAHGLAGGTQDAEQPVLLCQTDVNANNADILMAIDGAQILPDIVSAFTRVCILFDGNDPEALDVARGQWKQLSNAGFPAKYWSQETGAWREKASQNQT